MVYIVLFFGYFCHAQYQCPRIDVPLNGATNVSVDAQVSWNTVGGINGYSVSLEPYVPVQIRFVQRLCESDKSIYVENLDNGKFEISPLPMEAQIAPINDIALTDFNEDGNQDVLLIGNDYGNELFIGKYDAFHGLLLQGNGKGGFKSIPVAKSGFLVPGDAKRIVKVKSVLGKSVFVVGQNRDQV